MRMPWRDVTLLRHSLFMLFRERKALCPVLSLFGARLHPFFSRHRVRLMRSKRFLAGQRIVFLQPGYAFANDKKYISGRYAR